jgi:hypothetical protein
VDAASFKAKYPYLADRYDETLAIFKKDMDRIREDYVQRGIWNPEVPEEILERRAAALAGPGADEGALAAARQQLADTIYFPQQYSDEVMDLLERADLERELAGMQREFNVGRGTGGTISGTKLYRQVFEKTRKFVDQEDFLEHVAKKVEAAGGRKAKQLQELNIATLWSRRVQAHARRIANFDLLQQSKRYFGRDLENISRGYKDWLDAGAGRMKRREGIWEMIDFWNRRMFKPFVTVGIGPLPNPAFHIRNWVSGWWQATAHPEIGFMSGARHMAQVMRDGVTEILEKLPGIENLPRNQLGRILKGNVTDDLVRVGGEALPYTERKVMELLKEWGVTRHSFVSVEDLLDALEPLRAAVPLKRAGQVPKKVWRFLTSTTFPGKVAQFIEDRMRATGFVHALKRGLTPKQAAQATREAFIDYEIVSGAHRAIRDIVPFAQFDIGQIPRTVKTILERPRVLAPLGAAMPKAGDERFVPPWVREQPHFPIGLDKEGNPVFGVGASTPFENINRLWAGRLGRTMERNIGSTAPPIKAAYEQMSGREPFFGTEFGTYRRDVPFARLFPDIMVGRKKRTIKTAEGTEKEISEVSPGFLRALSYLPVTRQISMFNKLFDERKSIWQRSLGLLTGVKSASTSRTRRRPATSGPSRSSSRRATLTRSSPRF